MGGRGERDSDWRGLRGGGKWGIRDAREHPTYGQGRTDPGFRARREAKDGQRTKMDGQTGGTKGVCNSTSQRARSLWDMIGIKGRREPSPGNAMQTGMGSGQDKTLNQIIMAQNAHTPTSGSPTIRMVHVVVQRETRTGVRAMRRQTRGRHSGLSTTTIDQWVARRRTRVPRRRQGECARRSTGKVDKAPA